MPVNWSATVFGVQPCSAICALATGVTPSGVFDISGAICAVSLSKADSAAVGSLDGTSVILTTKRLSWVASFFFEGLELEWKWYAQAPWKIHRDTWGNR